jgi:glutamate carboxypeptidase
MPADRFLTYAKKHQAEMETWIRELVECESPSDDAQAVNRFVDLLAAKLNGLAKVKTFPGGKFGRHMRCEFLLPGKKTQEQGILGLGHSDTVYPLGILSTMPFRKAKGRLWGPGTLDMKGGLTLFIFAMRALRDLDVPVARKVILQVNSDEEVGSDSSRALTEEAAKSSAAVIVLEPGTGLEGKPKTARKGIGAYELFVYGKSSHAGVDFAAGANAVVEMARQLDRIAGFVRLEKGITVSPGVVRGGTRSNVVPAEAYAHIDFRVPTLKDAAWLDKQFAGLRPFDPRCRLELRGGLNRPPMERSAGVRKLFGLAKSLARELGVELEESSTGGGSDGNFTAALGIPTIDGMGVVGEGAHATHESILVNRLADRTALLAKLVAAI